MPVDLDGKESTVANQHVTLDAKMVVIVIYPTDVSVSLVTGGHFVSSLNATHHVPMAALVSTLINAPVENITQENTAQEEKDEFVKEKEE